MERERTRGVAGAIMPAGPRLLGVAGGMLYLFKAGRLAGEGVPGAVSPAYFGLLGPARGDWPDIPWAIDAGYVLAYAVVGLAALVAIARARQALGDAAAPLALAGALGLLLDASGIVTAPWLVPGVMLLVVAAVAMRADTAAVRPAPPARPGMAARIAVAIALLAHILPAFPALAIGLVVPLYGLVGLYAIWAAMLALALSVRHRSPWLLLAIPPTTFAITYRLLLVFGEVFGWQA